MTVREIQKTKERLQEFLYEHRIRLSVTAIREIEQAIQCLADEILALA